MDIIINLAMTYVAFLIAAGSPGPTTVAIMATSATMGRKAGVLFALGVVNGSIIWGMLAGLIRLRHTANIARILRDQEPRIGKKNKACRVWFTW